MIRIYGDSILDTWIYGSVDRVSPEAPVVILKESQVKNSAGGAANVSENLVNLGNTAKLYSACALDDAGNTLTSLVRSQKFFDQTHSVTTHKTRMVDSSGKHIMRLDREECYYKNNLIDQLIQDLSKNDILVVSDYNKGTIKEDTVAKLKDRCVNILVDPKQHPSYYRDAWLVKPNMKEFESWVGEFTCEKAFLLMQEYNWHWLVVTAGANGLYVFKSTGEFRHYSEPVREVADVSGAGDIVIAVIAHCLDQGLDVYKSAEIACYAAARSVERQGITLVELNDLVKGTVFTNGCFDILHLGHLRLLEAARSKGKKLIVGLNSDASVKRLKGNHRPINSQDKRKAQLEALPWVDQVIVFDEDTPLDLIKKINPDLIVKGGDYTVDQVIGNHLAQVYIFPSIKDFSTTDIIEKSNENFSNWT
jgi:D-beta-D-heptose 7-phosphate kinase/D-beta-D-heptose 1-phosphate adenosyltransferase